MTKFEYIVNGGKFEGQQINAMVIDLNKDESFDAWINAKSLSEVDGKLPEGFEMDKLTTLQNYFDHNTINKFQVELDSSQFVYFATLDTLVDGGLYTYTDALKVSDFNTTSRLDRKYVK